MSIQTEIETSVPLIIKLLAPEHVGDFSSEQDKRLPEIAQALNVLFNNDPNTVISILRDVSTDAPLTFNRNWPNVLAAILDSHTTPARAIFLLGRLLGWAYIETAWNAQVTNRPGWTLSADSLAILASIQMGLPATTNPINVLSAILTNSSLYSMLLLNRFEQTVKGGLEHINNMETRLSTWEAQLNATEERANKSEARISAYNDTLEKYKIAFGFGAMSQAYKGFFLRKTKEKLILFIVLAVLFCAILAIPIGSYFVVHKPEVAILELAKGYIPFATFILLLIYFFRVVLLHYNSTQAQLIQLEIKIASLTFIQEYVTFLKQNNSPDLSKFESLIFGGIVADLGKMPSTFDGIEQLMKTIMQLKGEKA